MDCHHSTVGCPRAVLWWQCMAELHACRALRDLDNERDSHEATAPGPARHCTARQAARCVREIDTGMYMHELVKQLVVTSIDKPEAQQRQAR